MLDEFHQFPDLPTELRLKIWKFYLRIPREVEIQLGYSYPHGHGRYFGGSQPSLLGVNTESRREGQAHYRRYFGQSNTARDSRDQSPECTSPECTYDKNDFDGFAPDHDALGHVGICLNPAFDTVRVHELCRDDWFRWQDLQYFERIAVTDLCFVTKQGKVVLPIGFVHSLDFRQLGSRSCTSMHITMPVISTDPAVAFDGTTMLVQKYEELKRGVLKHPEITIVREDTGQIVAIRPRCSHEDDWHLTGLERNENDYGWFGRLMEE